jgi:hypothetical protein
LSPSAWALLIDTYDYPDDLSDQPVLSHHPRFEYHVDPGSVFVFRYHETPDSIHEIDSIRWTPKEEFIFLEGQFDRFFATLPRHLRGDD